MKPTAASCVHLLHDRTVCSAAVCVTTARVTWPTVRCLCVLRPWLNALSSERWAESSRAQCKHPVFCCDAEHLEDKLGSSHLPL